MRIPEGINAISFPPVQGWERTVETKPIPDSEGSDDGHGDAAAERVASVTWRGGRIAPGEFHDSGEVVRWIDEADSDLPAARVTLRAPVDEVESDSGRANLAIGLGVGGAGRRARALALAPRRRGSAA